MYRSDQRPSEALGLISMIVRWLQDGKRDVVLLLGAAMGREAKPAMPLGFDIALQLAGALRFPDPEAIARKYTLDEIAEWYEHAESWPALVDFIEAQIEDEKRQPGPTYKIAAKLPFTHYVTVNYDTVLERTFDALRLQKQVIHQPFNDAIKRDRKVIFKIHGSIERHDRSTFIITTEQYEDLYTINSPFHSQLKNWIIGGHLVLVGYNFRTPEFQRLYNLGRQELRHAGGGTPGHIAIGHNTNQQERDFWRRRGILILDMPIGLFFKVLQGHFLETPDEHQLIREYTRLTGAPPAPELIEQEMKRWGPDRPTVLLLLVTLERFRAGYIGDGSNAHS